jgi:hypothetical protein
VTDSLGEADALRAFAHRLIRLDDPADTAGVVDRQTITLNEIIKGARQALTATPDHEDVVRSYRELLWTIWLYVDWRYVTRQLTTEQKELWADAVDQSGDPEEQGQNADRWWRPGEATATDDPKVQVALLLSPDEDAEDPAVGEEDLLIGCFCQGLSGGVILHRLGEPGCVHAIPEKGAE